MSSLDATLASFRANVTPEPEQTYLYCDGLFATLRHGWEARRHRDRVDLLSSPVQRGFCSATATLWQWAVEPGVDYVFWLEHDFVLLRPLDLRPLAVVLDADRRLAQMALVRGPVSPDEVAAGGLVASRPGEFVPREPYPSDILGSLCAGPGAGVEMRATWLEHRSYFTTNPSLMRRDFMVEHPLLDDGDPACEGRYGIGLRDAGFTFGAWGDGEPWVDHVGVRSGHGY
jgi:hypothetical protein